MRHCLAAVFVLMGYMVYAQTDFDFGKVTWNEVDMTSYVRDSSAVAVVLNEFGHAYLDDANEHNLLFKYHVKIKILKQEGLQYADIEIPLAKIEKKSEVLREVKASSFTLVDGKVVESQVPSKSVFTENRTNHDIKKLAIPNVRVGSVIEFAYTLESPFLFKFRSWEFQSEIPKVYSEYCARIPGNYLYNITLKGYLKLVKNENGLEKGCFNVGGGNVADCAVYNFAMKDIPAFVEEDYMTAKSNFLSAINFELSEIHFFDGRVDKVTKEWKDAELELRQYGEFGQQLKKADGVMRDIITPLVAQETDPLMKAKKIYEFVSHTYEWNSSMGIATDKGVKKTFETKSGNVADINFLLIGALRAAGLEVDPVILSTRSNGLPTELHPVITDFNYVIARINIGDKSILLDATDPFHPFGLLPERCLNGKGRVMTEKTSYWIDLKPAEKAKKVSNLKLSLDTYGSITGTVQTTYTGYEAVKIRKAISRFEKQDEFVNSLSEKVPGLEITGFQIQNYQEVDRPLVLQLDLSFAAFDQPNANNFLLSPFIFDREKENPFKSQERLYPVDFGSPREIINMFTLDFPTEFQIANIPERIALSLPNAGGRYLFQATGDSSRLSVSHSLLINKSVFTADEYRYLRELYSRIIQVHNEEIIFQRKL